MPWEDLVAVCREMEATRLIDGARGIGLIDLTHLGKAYPDFFVNNCHMSAFSFLKVRVQQDRWMCGLQHPYSQPAFVRTSFPMSHPYLFPGERPDPFGKPRL